MQQKIQAVDRIDVERIADGNDQSSFAKSYGNDFEAARIRRRDLVNDLLGNSHGREIEPIHVCLRGERTGNIGLGNHPVFYENIDCSAGAIQPRLGVFNLRTRYESDVLKDIEHVIFVWMHSWDIAIERQLNQAKLLGLLFHGHALREVTRFVDIAAKFDREMIGEQLKRNGSQDRAEKIGRARKRDDVSQRRSLS